MYLNKMMSCELYMSLCKRIKSYTLLHSIPLHVQVVVEDGSPLAGSIVATILRHVWHVVCCPVSLHTPCELVPFADDSLDGHFHHPGAPIAAAHPCGSLQFYCCRDIVTHICNQFVYNIRSDKQVVDLEECKRGVLEACGRGGCILAKCCCGTYHQRTTETGNNGRVPSCCSSNLAAGKTANKDCAGCWQL